MREIMNGTDLSSPNNTSNLTPTEKKRPYCPTLDYAPPRPTRQISDEAEKRRGYSSNLPKVIADQITRQQSINEKGENKEGSKIKTHKKEEKRSEHQAGVATKSEFDNKLIRGKNSNPQTPDHRVSNTHIQPVSQLMSFWKNIEESSLNNGKFYVLSMVSP